MQIEAGSIPVGAKALWFFADTQYPQLGIERHNAISPRVSYMIRTNTHASEPLGSFCNIFDMPWLK